jgi:hypothetical protein
VEPVEILVLCDHFGIDRPQIRVSQGARATQGHGAGDDQLSHEPFGAVEESGDVVPCGGSDGTQEYDMPYSAFFAESHSFVTR